MYIAMLIKAFVGGCIICAIGQVLIDYTKLTPARILVSFVVIGVILGGIGLYQPLIDFAGAGATVPLTGFGATLAKGVREAVAADGFFGALTGGLTASAGGITVAIVAALLKDGRTQISGLWSEKTGKTYTATVALTDDGTRASFRLEFSHE